MFSRIYVYLGVGLVGILLMVLLVRGIGNIQKANLNNIEIAKQEAKASAIRECNESTLKSAAESNKRIQELVDQKNANENAAVAQITRVILTQRESPAPVQDDNLIPESLVKLLMESKKKWPAE